MSNELLTILDIDVSKDINVLKQYPTLLLDILSGHTTGAILRGFYQPNVLAPIVEQLAKEQCSMRSRPSPYFTGRTYGRLLTAETDLNAYYNEAKQVNKALHELFTPIGDFQTRLEQTLATLSNQKPVQVPLSPEGHSYLSVSTREMLPGGSIDLHYENENFDCPTMKYLASQLDAIRQGSIYLTLAAPEGGGELRIYPVKEKTETCAKFSAMDRTSQETFSLLEQEHGYRVLDAAVGDLLIFDAGRHYHRVTTVTGKQSRWTMGSFFSHSNKGVVHYWS